jgi:hypothetical protein
VSKEVGPSNTVMRYIEAHNIGNLTKFDDVRINGISNPPSTQPIGPFKINLLDFKARRI